MAETKLSRAEMMQAIIERDGPFCRVPGCRNPEKFTELDPMTIEHVQPKARGGTADLDNLEIAHQKCNQWKGDRVYIGLDEQGERVLEEIPYREPKSKVIKRPPCPKCMEGRSLSAGQECPVCGSGPQPLKYPRYMQRKPTECDHSEHHCWMCFLGFIERESVFSYLAGE